MNQFTTAITRFKIQVGSISPIAGLSLDLVNVDRHANGDYICTASNGVGMPASASISVEVQCKNI